MNKKDENNIIEEEELDGFVKDLMDLVKKVFRVSIICFVFELFNLLF
jgi:hypothetical protein